MTKLQTLPMYVDNIFSIPLIRTEVNNWQSKKEKILNQCKDLKISGKEFVETNFHYNLENKNLSQDMMNVEEILKEELDEFQHNLGYKIKVNGSWIERSIDGMNHEIHNHGQIGYSAACFVTFDPAIHTPTHFIAPFNHVIDGSIIKHTPENITEGTIIFFPSMLLHYTTPNFSPKERIVLSFNLITLN